ncbi:MAG: hypothetical protein NTX63_04535 [Candidatus Peregrinibacteria bacterium]|nr:hypothetical protein [Candidatus Peregrinibacteria bacterium]
MSEFHLNSQTAHGRIRRALKNNSLLLLRKGLYVTTSSYLHESNRITLVEFIASKLRTESYISLEYVLEKFKILMPRSVRSITSITRGQTSTFENFAGHFVYKNIKPSCYFGYEEVKFRDQIYHIATKAKALFDYLYLMPEFGSRSQKFLRVQLFEKSSLQWENFSEEDFALFESCVWKSNSFKMMRLRQAIGEYFESKKFDEWRRQLLA